MVVQHTGEIIRRPSVLRRTLYRDLRGGWGTEIFSKSVQNDEMWKIDRNGGRNILTFQ